MAVERRAALLKQQRSIDTREALLVGAAAVFARVSYGEARTRDIAAESGISEGAMYFHFGTKADVANAILQLQQERMSEVLAKVQKGSGPVADKLERLMTQLAKLIARDEVVQAGIRLASQPSDDLADNAAAPYFEWVQTARELLAKGIEDGSIRADIDVDREAELLNAAFVGTQVLSGLADSWASFPKRLKRVLPLLLGSLRAS